MSTMKTSKKSLFQAVACFTCSLVPSGVAAVYLVNRFGSVSAAPDPYVTGLALGVGGGLVVGGQLARRFVLPSQSKKSPSP